jgi:secreted PhoX family phosphatase
MAARARPGGAPGPDPLAGEGRDGVQARGGDWFDRGTVYVATTGDSRILAYDVRSKRIKVFYDPDRLQDPPLRDVDNIAVSPGGELFVCEDNVGDDPFDVCLITLEPRQRVSHFAKLTGPQHGSADTEASSEIAGVAFNPRGDRMYFSSQRAFVTGVVYEVSGPFKRSR